MIYCYLGLRGKEPGGPEEQTERTEQAWMAGDQGYKKALLSHTEKNSRIACRRQTLIDETIYGAS